MKSRSEKPRRTCNKTLQQKENKNSCHTFIFATCMPDRSWVQDPKHRWPRSQCRGSAGCFLSDSVTSFDTLLDILGRNHHIHLLPSAMYTTQSDKFCLAYNRCVSLPLVLSFMILEIIKADEKEGPPAKKHKAGMYIYFTCTLYIYIYI